MSPRWRIGLRLIVGAALAVACTADPSSSGPAGDGPDSGTDVDGAVAGDAATSSDAAGAEGSIGEDGALAPTDGGLDGAPPKDASVTCEAGAAPGGLGVCTGDGWCWGSQTPQGNDLYALAGNAPNDLWAFGANAILHYDGVSWTLREVPKSINALIDDQVTMRGAWASPTRVWAAGDYDMVLRWDGVAWDASTTGFSSKLFAVWGSSETDVWAGGDPKSPAGSGLARWNGATWASIAIGAASRVRAISGVAANDVWAVGPDGAFHYTGGSSAGRIYTGAVRGVHAFASNDVWFSTSTGSLHWNGTNIQSSSPDGAGAAIWGATTDDLWSVDAFGQAWHRDAAAWSSVALPVTSTGGGGFNAVRGSSPTDVWAVGNRGVMAHFDGVAWSAASTQGMLPTFKAVWGASPADVWAVGIGGASGNLIDRIAHYNGSAWSMSGVTHREPLIAVFGTSAANVWAVGGFDRYVQSPPNGPRPSQGLIARWNGATWNTEWETTGAGYLRGVWAASPNDAWAVGQDFPCPSPPSGSCSGMLHYDGLSWSQAWVGPPDERAEAIFGFASNDVWVAANQTLTPTPGRILHWDGALWTVATAVPTHGSLTSIWGSGPADVWMVGAGIQSGDGVALHYDGAAWTRTTFPMQGSGVNLRTSMLGAVHGRAWNDVWSLGYEIARHWDGVSWTKHQLPSANQLSHGLWMSDCQGMFATGNFGILYHP